MTRHSHPKRPTAETLGVLGLPDSLKNLTRRRWDAIVVGAGHNGLTCAAYLAKAGWQVLVLEARERVGGACTLEETWPGYRISPCAYLAGLLHPQVMADLQLKKYGFRWTPATPGLFVPFEDGSYVQLWEDSARCEAEIKRIAPADVAGWRNMGAVMDRLRDYLRPPGEDDLWLDPEPSREKIEARLGDDEEARALLFEWSMAEYLDHYLSDERLKMAYLGQGVIGTNASPFHPGTASINFHHSSGRMGDQPGMWGYVDGGMGMVSFILADVARDLGVSIATGTPVSQILPGEGVELAGGERLHAPVIIANADPRTTLGLLGEAADSSWQTQVESVPQTGCTVKLNVALQHLPNFKAKPGLNQPHHRGQINTPLTPAEWQSSFAQAQAGELPPRLWTELYFQTAYDASVAPEGVHTMSVFAQYVPHRFAEGDWDSRRTEVADVALASIGRFCQGFANSVIAVEVSGPPDIERKVGLWGGHIFQGECLPEFMWERRLAYQTPMPGVYLCGAATHPGGSVIAVNGRNAAQVVLAEAKR